MLVTQPDTSNQHWVCNPRAASCESAVVKVHGGVEGQEREKCSVRPRKLSAVSHTMWRLKAMVSVRPDHIGPSYAWQRGRESLGGSTHGRYPHSATFWLQGFRA